MAQNTLNRTKRFLRSEKEDLIKLKDYLTLGSTGASGEATSSLDTFSSFFTLSTKVSFIGVESPVESAVGVVADVGLPSIDEGVVALVGAPLLSRSGVAVGGHVSSTGS